MSGKLMLRTDLRIFPQTNVKRWRCVVEDPETRRFYRMGRREYLIASLLDGNSSFPEVLERIKQQEWGKELKAEFIQNTVRWLMANQLVRIHGNPNEVAAPGPAASASKKGGSSEIGIPSGDPFGFRIPVLHGDWLNYIFSKLRFVYSLPTLLIGMVLAIAASITALTHLSDLGRIGSKLFVPDSVHWWFLAWILLKTVHESGHAMACTAYGGRLRTAGLAFFFFAPVPYVDATDIWRFPGRGARILCAMAGIIAELFVASLAVLIAFWTTNSTLQFFCVTIATLGTLTTIIFNANPLTRFDGYHALCDILDRPSLWQDGQLAAQKVVKSFSLTSTAEFSWSLLPLAAYGVGCSIYRFLILIGLAWSSWLAWRGIGLLLIAIGVYLWFLAPMLKKWTRSSSSTSTPAATLRSLIVPKLVPIGFGLLLFIGSYFLPSPWQPKVPGVVTYFEPATLRIATEGIVDSIHARDGSVVHEGDSLIRSTNPKLLFEKGKIEIDKTIAEERSKALRADQRIAQMQSEEAKIAAIDSQLSEYDYRVENLTVKAPRSGLFISRQIHNKEGMFVKSGDVIGMIVDPRRKEVHASVPQFDVETYRAQVGKEVWIHTNSGKTFSGRIRELHPRCSDSLEIPTLAARYGGPIPVKLESASNDKDPLKTLEPRSVAKIDISELTADKLVPGEGIAIELVETKRTVWEMAVRWGSSICRGLLPDRQPTP